MMSKLLDLLQRIGDGSPAPLGFGAARDGNLPGLALIGLVAADQAASIAAAAGAGVDAVIVSGVGSPADLPDLNQVANGLAWGIQGPVLSASEIQAGREAGADLLVFSLASNAAAIAGEDDLARLVLLNPDRPDRELRAISALPVDGFVVELAADSGAWTLEELVAVGSLTRRTDKYVLVQVSGIPEPAELEALRDMGASGLVIDLAAVAATDLAGLKSVLLQMPRPRPRRRDRTRVAPGAGFTPANSPAHHAEDDD